MSQAPVVVVFFFCAQFNRRLAQVGDPKPEAAEVE